VCCSVLRCVAVCCRMLQCVATNPVDPKISLTLVGKSLGIDGLTKILRYHTGGPHATR